MPNKTTLEQFIAYNNRTASDFEERLKKNLTLSEANALYDEIANALYVADETLKTLTVPKEQKLLVMSENHRVSYREMLNEIKNKYLR